MTTGFLTCALLLCTTAPSSMPSADAARSCSVCELNEIRYSSRATGLLLTTGVVQSVHDDPFRAAVILENDGWRTKLAQTNSIPLPKPGDRIAFGFVLNDHDEKDFGRYTGLGAFHLHFSERFGAMLLGR